MVTISLFLSVGKVVLLHLTFSLFEILFSKVIVYNTCVYLTIREELGNYYTEVV